MNWEKKGLIYLPEGNKEWSLTHAQVPVADFIESEDIIRVYFSTRDKLGRSYPDFIEVEADNPHNIVKYNDEPLLKLGKLGTFDDCGVMPSWVVTNKEKKYLYYIGWNVRNTIAYHNSIGLAISEDGGMTFSRFSEGPLWDRNYNEPHYSGTSCVIYDKGIWKNWYLSCTEWRFINGKSEPRYHIKYAESEDGINWLRLGKIAIDYKDQNEAGIVKASVIRDKSIYKMWYSYRNFNNYRTDKNNSYRIGYAESHNGINWLRKDNSSYALDVSPKKNEWDSEMVEYPHVIDVKGRRLMFYNGNGFGKSGFGYAELKQ